MRYELGVYSCARKDVNVASLRNLNKGLLSAVGSGPRLAESCHHTYKQVEESEYSSALRIQGLLCQISGLDLVQKHHLVTAQHNITYCGRNRSIHNIFFTPGAPTEGLASWVN
jgi:hypothetical protein